MSEEKNEFAAAKGDWDSSFPTNEERAAQRNEKRTEWMKFPKPGTYQVRLVGPFVEFHRHNKPFDGERVITNIKYKEQDPAWQAGFYPRQTFAIHIIDRADGKLKILEKGNSVFRAFSTYKKVNDINPAGKEAPDFSINVEWPDGNKFQAKYTVTALAKIKGLSDEEVALWQSGKAPLNEIYKSTPLAKIQELWDALPEEKKTPPKKEDPKAPAAAAPKAKAKVEAKLEESMPSAPAENDDLFGASEKGESDF